MSLNVRIKGKTDTIQVQDALHVPGISANLLSVSKIVQKGYQVIFNEKGCQIIDSQNSLIATASLINDVYRLNQPKSRNHINLSVQDTTDIDLWHRRLGHINRISMKIARDKTATGIKFIDTNPEPCIICLKGKQHRLPFIKSNTRAMKSLQLIHSDLCGPMENTSIGGSRYFLTFIDDHTRKVFVYFLSSKEQTLEKFQEFKAFAEKQSGHKIQKLRTDNGKEYVNGKFKSFLQEEGIQHRLTVAYAPE